MGNCCCCGDAEEVRGHHRLPAEPAPAPRQWFFRSNSTTPIAHSSAPVPVSQPSVARAHSPPKRCEYCGKALEAALMDGHRESCRINHRLQMKNRDAPQPTSTPTAQVPCDDPDDLCLVCMAAERCYAFVPCGHLAVCVSCAAALRVCPVCRSPSTQLLFVDRSVLKALVCRHCKNAIHPTYFASHQEVCALRQRESEEPYSPPLPTATAAPTTADEANRVVTEEKELCLECRKAKRQVALKPCGHYILCVACAKALRACPVCCSDIQETVKMYEC